MTSISSFFSRKDFDARQLISEECIRIEIARLLSNKGFDFNQSFADIRTKTDGYGSVIIELGAHCCSIYRKNRLLSLEDINQRFLNPLAVDYALYHLMTRGLASASQAERTI